MPSIVGSSAKRARSSMVAVVVALAAALIVVAAQAAFAGAAQNFGCSGTCQRAYAAHSGNQYKIEGINYSRNGDICAGVSGHTPACNSNPAAGSFVYWTGGGRRRVRVRDVPHGRSRAGLEHRGGGPGAVRDPP